METPNLDAAVLLSFATSQPKIFLYAHSEQPLTAKQWTLFQKLIKRRAKYEPVAYLTGEKEFYGRTFLVDKRALIPRPETELIIDLAKTISAGTIIDVGTGSGAIAITLAKELHKQIIATDISTAALNVAKQNAKRHHAQIKFIRGNLLEPILKIKKLPPKACPLSQAKRCRRADLSQRLISPSAEALAEKAVLVVANLPYLPTGRAKFLPVDIKKYEPKLALYAGQDGLKQYRELLYELKNMKTQKWTLVAEIDSLQENLFRQMTKKILPTAGISFRKDLSGHIRVAIITKL